ncbi:MAG: nitroreductase family protein [Spirochaetia bacterium]|nr:nitroreductase family protein [Spirochaetales bacterium]MDX9783151.1 nitroreductase family protein [Spirochaetia bacterium]
MKEIEQRKSVRKYSSKQVEKEKLDAILESARIAPSGHNKQPWHFIVVSDPEKRQEIATVSKQQRWMISAPLHIVCIADIRARVQSPEPTYVDEETPSFELKRVIRDTAIAASHILLEARHQGLDTCWVGYYDQKDIRPVLGIPEDKFVVGVVTLGYADESPVPRPRKRIEEIVHYERW